MVASCDYFGKVILWDAKDGLILRRIDAHSDVVQFICFSPDGLLLASCSVDNTVKLWDARDYSLICQMSDHTN